MPKQKCISAPPEPYATVTLQRGAQSDDSCVKCSASPSSSEYNAPVREPVNLCDVLPPPPDHPYGIYKPPNNMTIRTNPVAMSPQIGRRIPPTPPRWGTMPPPIPNFPQNWAPERTNQPTCHPAANMDPRKGQEYYAENDYESGSVLYAQCCRPDESSSEYFNRGGEPTEEYYRNINMEFLEDQREFEPSTPPPPCPDPYNTSSRCNPNIRLLTNGANCHQMAPQQDNSPMNNRRTLRNQSGSNQSTQSSDESESDNRWAAPRARRSRSKSGDRKYRNNNSNMNNMINMGVNGGHYIR